MMAHATTKDRPLGVTIIAILTIIGGIGFLLSGIGAVGVAPFLPDLGILSGSNRCCPHSIRYCIFCYGLWFMERKRMGMDYNSGTVIYWNCIWHSFNCNWKYWSSISSYYQYNSCLLSV